MSFGVEKEFLHLKYHDDNLEEVRKLIALYLKNLKICMEKLQPTQFNSYKKEISPILSLADIYLSAINKITEHWSVKNLQNITSFLDKTISFNTYLSRYFQNPNEERFDSLESIYDSVLTYASEV